MAFPKNTRLNLVCLVQNKTSHEACQNTFKLANMQGLDPKEK